MRALQLCHYQGRLIVTKNCKTTVVAKSALAAGTLCHPAPRSASATFQHHHGSNRAVPVAAGKGREEPMGGSNQGPTEDEDLQAGLAAVNGTPAQVSALKEIYSSRGISVAEEVLHDLKQRKAALYKDLLGPLWTSEMDASLAGAASLEQLYPSLSTPSDAAIDYVRKAQQQAQKGAAEAAALFTQGFTTTSEGRMMAAAWDIRSMLGAHEDRAWVSLVETHQRSQPSKLSDKLAVVPDHIRNMVSAACELLGNKELAAAPPLPHDSLLPQLLQRNLAVPVAHAITTGDVYNTPRNELPALWAAWAAADWGWGALWAASHGLDEHMPEAYLRADWVRGIQVFEAITDILQPLLACTTNPWVHALNYWALVQKASLLLHTELIMMPPQPNSPEYGTEEWFNECEIPVPWDKVGDTVQWLSLGIQSKDECVAMIDACKAVSLACEAVQEAGMTLVATQMRGTVILRWFLRENADWVEADFLSNLALLLVTMDKIRNYESQLEIWLSKANALLQNAIADAESSLETTTEDSKAKGDDPVWQWARGSIAEAESLLKEITEDGKVKGDGPFWRKLSEDTEDICDLACSDGADAVKQLHDLSVDDPAVARTWFSRALVHAQLHDVRRGAQAPENHMQSSSNTSSTAGKAVVKKAVGFNKASLRETAEKKGQQESCSSQAPSRVAMVPLPTQFNYPVWTLATLVYKKLSVCYLPWRMTAGWRADEYAMALLYLHATGRPGLATPWSALQADLPHFPVQVLLQPEERMAKELDSFEDALHRLQKVWVGNQVDMTGVQEAADRITTAYAMTPAPTMGRQSVTEVVMGELPTKLLRPMTLVLAMMVTAESLPHYVRKLARLVGNMRRGELSYSQGLPHWVAYAECYVLLLQGLPEVALAKRQLINRFSLMDTVDGTAYIDRQLCAALLKHYTQKDPQPARIRELIQVPNAPLVALAPDISTAAQSLVAAGKPELLQCAWDLVRAGIDMDQWTESEISDFVSPASTIRALASTMVQLAGTGDDDTDNLQALSPGLAAVWRACLTNGSTALAHQIVDKLYPSQPPLDLVATLLAILWSTPQQQDQQLVQISNKLAMYGVEHDPDVVGPRALLDGLRLAQVDRVQAWAVPVVEALLQDAEQRLQAAGGDMHAGVAAVEREAAAQLRTLISQG